MSQLDNSTAEEVVDQLNGAWLFTEAHFFLGKEGKVENYNLLFNDDPLSGFSLAAYRKTPPESNTDDAQSPPER